MSSRSFPAKTSDDGLPSIQKQIDQTISFHGHWCPGVAMGHRAAEWVLTHLGRGEGEEIVFLGNSAAKLSCRRVPQECRAGSYVPLVSNHKHYDEKEFAMKKSFGAKTLAFPAPVWCVGSYDQLGKANVMTIAWGGICCSKPPAVTISLRKATYTYHNIMGTGAYTINIPSVKDARAVDYFGMASGKREDKFQASGLTAVRSELVDAPYIEEFPMILECRVIHTYEIGLHTQFIGEVLDVKVDESALDEDGLPDMDKVAPFIYGTEIQKYYRIGEQIGKAFKIGKNFS